MTTDPYDMLFQDLDKLGPGTDADTLRVLRDLPLETVRTVVDAGCGTGRQTLVLARELGVPVDAVDNHATFLEELQRRAKAAGLAHLVRPHHLDMRDIPNNFQGIDLLWAEGSAYAIGFREALSRWRSALSPEGWVVVSELSWLTDDRPEELVAFFDALYPDMEDVSGNLEQAAAAGYAALETWKLGPEAWTEGYYDKLESRSRRLVQHDDPDVRDLADELLGEIDMFRRFHGLYGYVFYALQRI